MRNSEELISEFVFKGSAETIEWYFALESFNTVTKEMESKAVNFQSKLLNARMELYVNNKTFRSSDGYIEFFDEGKVIVKLGEAEGIFEGQDYSARLKVFDDNNPRGHYLVHEDKPQARAEIKVRS